MRSICLHYTTSVFVIFIDHFRFGYVHNHLSSCGNCTPAQLFFGGLCNKKYWTKNSVTSKNPFVVCPLILAMRLSIDKHWPCRHIIRIDVQHSRNYCVRIPLLGGTPYMLIKKTVLWNSANVNISFAISMCLYLYLHRPHPPLLVLTLMPLMMTQLLLTNTITTLSEWNADTSLMH